MEDTENKQEVSQNNELEDLRRRIAELEARQAETAATPARPRFIEKLKNSSALQAVGGFVKKHGVVIIIACVLLIAFITLMTCFCGIRGIYVNTEDPNEFFSFGVSDFQEYSINKAGQPEVTSGKWKKKGDTLILTVKDELFGDVEIPLNCKTSNGNKTLTFSEDFMGITVTTEYKRVNLIKYKDATKKVKVNFDANGGEIDKDYSTKVKIGSVVEPPEAKAVTNGDLVFQGWYTSPEGYKESGNKPLGSGQRMWEKVTYYANWKDTGIRTMKFDANGGDCSTTQLSGEIGSTITLPSATHSNSDKIFVGWESNGKIYSTQGKYTVGKTNVTFIAKYISKAEIIITLSNDKSFYIFNKYKGSETDVVIPSECEGIPIKAIASGAFENEKITSITIPDSVTSIGDKAFENCSNLTSVTIGNGVTSIGEEAFRGCSGLTGVTIPNSVTSIGGSAFENCSSLISITIPDSVTSIGYEAFKNCSNLTSVTIGNGITNIGNKAFYYCINLTSITIPDSVKSIGDEAFDNCKNLTSVTIENGVTNIGDKAFYYCINLTSITIPNSVTSIGEYAFEYCSNLPSVTIPNSVTSIGDKAFENCSNLTNVTIGSGVTSIGKYAFNWCSRLTNITIPDSVASIDRGTFDCCGSLTNVTIGNSVTSIGEYAFSRCSSLTTVYYTGTEEEWAAIKIGRDNDPLKNATVIYNYKP